MKRIEGIEFTTNRKEIYRYMGYRANQQPEEAILAMVEECMEELEQTATIRGLYRTDPLHFDTPSEFMLADFHVNSKFLGHNLEGCQYVTLVAATMGAQTDLLIARYSRLTVAKAVVMQSCAAAMIESWLDAFCEQLRKEFMEQGFFTHPRFSPGFADFGTEYQKPFLQALNAQKLLGITLASDSNMMLPMKSVTAVIGASKQPFTRLNPYEDYE